MKKRIILNLKDFKKLCAGNEISKDGVDIILSDIGIVAMWDTFQEEQEKLIIKHKKQYEKTLE